METYCYTHPPVTSYWLQVSLKPPRAQWPVRPHPHAHLSDSQPTWSVCCVVCVYVVCVRESVNVCACECECVSLWMRVLVCVRAHMCLCVGVRVWMRVHVCFRMCVFVWCVWVCVWLCVQNTLPQSCLLTNILYLGLGFRLGMESLFFSSTNSLKGRIRIASLHVYANAFIVGWQKNFISSTWRRITWWLPLCALGPLVYSVWSYMGKSRPWEIRHSGKGMDKKRQILKGQILINPTHHGGKMRLSPLKISRVIYAL